MEGDGVTGMKDRPMGGFQYVLMGLCIFLNVVDGFDTLSMSFAAPALAREWGIRPEMLGAVFSASSIGLVAGALLISPLGDRLGRRPVILGASALIAVVMLLLPLSTQVSQLLILRFLTGVGVGALVPSLNVMVSEYSNKRLGALFLALLHIGYAIGAITSSMVGATLIEPFGWRAIFWAAAGLNLLGLVCAFFILPESLEFLNARRAADALAKTNRILRRLGAEALSSLPPLPTQAAKAGLSELLKPGLLAPTLFLWAAGFAHYFVSYFQSSWTPKILVDAGLSHTVAISSGVVIGVGAAIGNLSMGALAAFMDVRRLTTAYYVLCALSLLAFGLVQTDPVLLLGAAGLSSLFIQGSFTGLLINSTRLYPGAVRSTGVGFTVGVGRLGGVLSPYLAGVMIGMGWSRPTYYPIFAAVCAAGGLAMLLTGTRNTARRAEPAHA